MNLLIQAHPVVKEVLDVASAATAIATIIQLLPAAAALMTIIWTGIRIYDWWKNKHVEDT